MSKPIVRSGQVASLVALTGLFSAPAVLADSSAANIKNCPAGNWCAYHRTVDTAFRHSPLKQITTENVKDLRAAWLFQPGVKNQGMHSTPLVIDGTMYVSTNPSSVWALDAASGQRKWSFVPKMDDAVVARSFFSHTRGLSIGDGRVYMGTADGRIIALNEKDGSVIWDKQIVDSKKDTAGFSGAGTFVSSDLLVIGQNGGEYPVEGKIFGIDPKTGDVKWTFYTTGRDDPKALATWGGDSWKYGGGGSWQPGTVDYANNQVVFGTGNPNPDYDYCGDKCRDVNVDAWRPGDNLYTSSVVALDLGTGKLKWYFQEAPSDPYDYDGAPGEALMISKDGKDYVVHPGKNGFMHVFDRKTGKPIKVYPNQKSLNWTTGFNLETGQWENMLWPKVGEKTLVCPAIDGGHSWNAGSYDPNSGTFYRIVNEWCMFLTVNPKEGAPATGGSETRTTEPFAQAFMAAQWQGTNPPNEKVHARLVALDPITGTIKWEKRYEPMTHSFLLTTDGGLLFQGGYDGYLEAINSADGKVLWKFNVGSGTNGGIVSYEAGGKQYIAAATGHGSYVGRAIATLFKDNPNLTNIQESALVVAFSLP